MSQSQYKPSRMSETSASQQIFTGYDPEGVGKFKCLAQYQTVELATSFNVRESVKRGDFYEYRLIGTDPKTKKMFDVMRRIRHFYVLRACFILKFPGLYVPPLPKKQAMGSQTQSTNQLRMFILNRFIKQIALCPYLIESNEFQVFLHPSHDLEKQMADIMLTFEQKPVWYLKTLEPHYFIQGTFQESEIEAEKRSIVTFATKCKKMRDFLSKIMDTIIESEKRFEKNRQRVQGLNRFLYEYERQSVQSYSPAMNVYLGKHKSQRDAEAEQQRYLLF